MTSRCPVYPIYRVGDAMFNNSLYDNETFHFYDNHDNQTDLSYVDNDNATLTPVFRSVTIETRYDNVTTTSYGFELQDYETSLYVSDLALINGSMDSYVVYVTYAIVIPVIGVIGIMLNVMSILVLRRSHIRSLGSFFIHALLIFDIFLLATLILVTTPGAFLGYYYPDGPPRDLFQPWPILDATQMLYVVVSPLVSLAHDLDLWCVVALLGEQYAAHRRPTWLTRKDSHEFGVKVVVTFLAAGLIGRMVSFFKYIRREVFYGYRTAHKKVCLSAYYQTRNIQVYDRYATFSVFSLLPLLLLLLLIVAILVFAILRIRYRRRSSAGWEMNEEEMGRIFKGIRSTQLALTLALTALCLHGASSALYILSVKRLGDDAEFLDPQCHVIPLEVKVDYERGPEFVMIYHVLLAAPASIRFFTIYVGLKEFRKDFGRGVQRKWKMAKRIFVGVFLPHRNADGSPPTPPPPTKEPTPALSSPKQI